MKSSLIEIAIGNPIKFEDGRIGILRDIKLVPNGMSNPELVSILYVEIDSFRGKVMMSATSNRFTPVDEFEYEEFYPSVHSNRLSEQLSKQEIEYKPSHG
jgi:hypothetical protein